MFVGSNKLFDRMCNNKRGGVMTPEAMNVASFSRVNVSEELGKNMTDVPVQ